MGPSAAEAAVPATATAAIRGTIQRSIVSSESRENRMPVFGGTGVNEIARFQVRCARHARACPGHPRLSCKKQERRGWPGPVSAKATPGQAMHSAAEAFSEGGKPGHDEVMSCAAVRSGAQRLLEIRDQIF